MTSKPKVTRGQDRSKASHPNMLHALLEGMENRLERLIRNERDRTASLIDAAVDSLARTVHIGFETVEKRFKSVGVKFELMGKKIDDQHAELKGYIKSLDNRLAVVEQKIGLEPKPLGRT